LKTTKNNATFSMSSALPELIFIYSTNPPVQAGLILHQGYVPEKRFANWYHANWTQINPFTWLMAWLYHHFLLASDTRQKRPWITQTKLH